MSVYKPSNSPYYHIDFVWRGHRVHKTTGATSRREAEALEKVEREHAKKRVADQKSATVSLALDHLVDRYWNEVGQHHAGANDAFRDLGNGWWNISAKISC
jgi:hypothetical protein